MKTLLILLVTIDSFMPFNNKDAAFSSTTYTHTVLYQNDPVVTAILFLLVLLFELACWIWFYAEIRFQKEKPQFGLEFVFLFALSVGVLYLLYFILPVHLIMPIRWTFLFLALLFVANILFARKVKALWQENHKSLFDN